ncbi:MAG: oligopeptidase A [Cellvibrionaceae bacterium]|nr:oligopeptidase A [Cellvibrionaceae bacterium]
MSESPAANPLLARHRLPPFAAIQPEHVLPAVQTLTQSNLAALDTQLQLLQEPSWESLVEPIEQREDELSQAWSPVSHLNSVANSPSLREAYNSSIALLTDYNTRMGQNHALFAAYERLAGGDTYQQLTTAKQTAIQNALRDFRLAGVSLPEEAKQRYGEIQTRLSELSNRFSNNVLDATQGWFKHITDPEELAGLPESALASAARAAKNRNLDGWVLTLDGPVYLTVMTQADNRELRREIYTAYMTRASDQGPTAGQWDNTALIEEILQLRQELARLLGFANYAELSIAPKMAQSTSQVLEFLVELAQKSRAQAERDLAELREWALTERGVAHLEVWDVPYYSEKLKEARYEISQEVLRPYFTLAKVLDGLFLLNKKLFGIDIKPQDGVETWHPDAQFYVVERNGKPVAYFYLDLFAREGKRGGAWMAECRVRRRTSEGLQLPVAYLVCNFNAPVGDTPSLLTHNEVTTLFHEFGHGLHHMLTQVDVAAVSGINGVAWDAVELPSQFMENWCWEPSVLKSLSGHHKTGASLPDDLIAKMLAAKNFQAAMMILRQIEFALFDFRLHMEYGTAGFPGVQALLDEVRREVAVLVPPSFNRFQNGFTHIFAGGYAAGYYSYKWAEVLSADAFAAFEENGLFDAATGERFLREILEKGGSEDAMVLFRRFRGREPDISALLRHAGIQV